MAESRAMRKGQHHRRVLRQFWPTFDDRFDLGNAVQTTVCFPALWQRWVKLKAGNKKIGRFQVRSMHVDLHKCCDLQRSRKHARDAVDDHVWVNQLTHHLLPGNKNFGSPRPRHRGPMFGAVEHAVVLVTDKSQSKIFEQWYNR